MELEMEFIRKLPSPQELKMEHPVDPGLYQIKTRRDQEIRDILTGKDARFLLIIGPCSADNEDAVTEYCTRLARVQEEVKETLFLIPRVYTNKPRTIGVGYKGMLHQPDILTGTMDAFASIISNNVNAIMKRMTSLSITLMIPTLIASFYGMNVDIHLEEMPYAFALIILCSVVLSTLAFIVFRKIKWF